MQIKFENAAFAVVFIIVGSLGLGVEGAQWRHNGPSLPWWGPYVLIACGIIMLCMELWAARKRK
ncbi:MAG: hypothetical protein PQJ28_04520 [Spirochaetales bacterium]|nr:hypothetical protein [Spirochaetales bacterium]